MIRFVGGRPSWTSRQAGAAVASLVATMLTGLVLATATDAQDVPYRWWLREDAPPDVDLFVLPADPDDWAAYTEASENRLDAWLAEADRAPDPTGTYVAVTFARPVSAALFAAVVAPLAGTVAQHIAIGHDAGGALVEETVVGPPSGDLYGRRAYDPGGGYDYVLDGIVAAEVWIGTSGKVGPAELDHVRARPEVAFLDTTAIQVLRVDLPTSRGGAQPADEDAGSVVDNIVMDGPWDEIAW